MSKRYQAGILTASYNGLKVPNAPTIGTATAGAGSASVTFTAPSDVGGGAITSYTVISSPGSITGTGSSSPVTVSGLTNGTAYTFTVVATNAYGTGPASAASNSVTPSVNYIEDVFSTYLYTGNGSTQTITNGIDLSTKGGLVWIKNRTIDADNVLYDTARGMQYWVSSNRTLQQIDGSGSGYYLTANSTGFGLVGNPATSNESGSNYASWTFRKQAKFFDIVTYTGNGTGARQISHNLGSEPGCIIVKRTNGVTQWPVYHRSVGVGNFKNAYLNLTDGFDVITNVYSPTSTYFTVTADGDVNASGGTYVAYLFAHNAGGFGLNGTDNVISCGSFTTDGSGNATIDLGYEPQWLLTKSSSSVNNWTITDTMRGWIANGGYADLNPNLSAAEDNYLVETFAPLTATGFKAQFTSGNASKTYIYIAIRRGPMKVPTSGTSVFAPVFRTTTTPNFVTNFVVDSSIYDYRPGGTGIPVWTSRLLGGNGEVTSSTGTEVGLFGADGYAFNNGVGTGNPASTDVITWNVQRAPGFHDVVCYTGTGSARTVTHNLGVAPEMMIVKVRDSATNWAVYSAAVGNNYYAILNLPDAPYTSSAAWNNTTPTSSVFTVGTNVITNGNGYLYVAYLFASCPGVSKVGSYTGTGTTLQVNCGFTGGARFVLIKRTDSTGDWYVWDSARGIVAGNDPYLLLNSTAAEVTNTDYVDTYSAGFEISSTAPAAINANGGTYIYLAIA